MNPTNLFDENDKRIPKGFLIIIGGFVVLICFWIYFSIDGDFSKLKNIFSSDAIKYWISVFAGFITSLFATFFYEYNKSLKNTEKLKFLGNIAHKGLLSDIVSELQFYNNRYYEFYNIIGTLKNSKVKNFIEVTIDYSFRKVLNKGSVDLQFIRIRNEEERQRLKEKKDNGSFLDFEYFDSFDETDFEKDSEFTADSYRVINNSVLIDNLQIPIVRTVKDNEILYTGSVPHYIAKKDASVDISFSIQFLLEKDSYLNFIFELPIQELECAINYEDVRDEIFIGGTYYLSSNRDHPPFDRGRREHEFFVKQKGWVMPKSSLVFIWWKQTR